MQAAAAAAKQAEPDESWKTQDPFAFLPVPGDNTDVHEEITLSDGNVLRFKNTTDLLKAHLDATKGGVCAPLLLVHAFCTCFQPMQCNPEWFDVQLLYLVQQELRRTQCMAPESKETCAGGDSLSA